MALVRDECLLPCKDAPELGYVKESSPEQYVPDVFYKVGLSHSVKSSIQSDFQIVIWGSMLFPFIQMFFNPCFNRTKTNLETMSRF